MSANSGGVGLCWEIRDVTRAVARRTGIAHGNAYVVIPNPVRPDDGSMLSGPIAELRPWGLRRMWAIPVDDCDGELARAWRSLWDERVYRYRYYMNGAIRSAEFRRTDEARFARSIIEHSRG